jgi:hypothetical protein
MGVPDACRRLAGLRENDPRLLLKACAGGDFPECSNLNPPAGLQ